MSKIIRVEVKGELLNWAIERSGIAYEELANYFPNLAEWVNEEKKPTFNQLEQFSKKTRTPFGYLFLKTPPEEKLPIPHFRSGENINQNRPSPELLETVETMQRRQEWMREYLIEEREEPLPFVGTANVNSDIVSVVTNIRDVLGIDAEWAQQHESWSQACYALRETIDNAGILVTRNGVVGNNNWRKLDVDEFRGFVLVDNYSPLIFINGADFEGAQLFTMAHELAHIWLGSGSAFNLLNLQPFDNEQEKFCDAVAAEFLVPANNFRTAWGETAGRDDRFKILSRRFKVSIIVIARRALDLRYIGHDEFFEFYEKHKSEQDLHLEKKKSNKKSGGDFFNNQNVRIGKRFFTSIYQAAREGRVLYNNAYKLTGLYGATFDNYYQRLQTK